MLLAFALLALPWPALAAVDGVSVRLGGGEVRGTVQGQGKATVRAVVANDSGRPLTGIRVGVYYSATDELPGDGARWRVHEFVVDPPLLSGKSITLKFSDENALEYVKLDVQRASFGQGLSYNGKLAALTAPLEEHDGAVYAGTRDLMDLIGGSISYDAKAYMIVLERHGVQVQVQAKLKYALVGGRQTPLAHPVIEVDGRSLLPVADIAELFGMSAEQDSELNLLVLQDSQ